MQLASGERVQPSFGRPGELELLERLIHRDQIRSSFGPQDAEMRRPPEEHVILHGHPLGDHRLLGHDRDEPSSLASGICAEFPPPEIHTALERHETGHRMKERRLARPVRPDRAHPGARRHLEGDVSEDLLTAESDAEPLDVERDRSVADVEQRGHAALLPVRRSAIRKNGAPTNAVMTPIGISAGATAVRATRSTRIRNDAPNRTESGRTCR